MTYNRNALFLLYLSVMLAITFLQQEFVLLPELNSIDLVGEETKTEILQQFHKNRWLSYIIPPIALILRLSLVSFCLFVGGYFFPEMKGKKYHDWWSIVLYAQIVYVLYSVSFCIANIIFGASTASIINSYVSFLFLFKDGMEPWVRVPLAIINIFEVSYWLLLSFFVSKKLRVKYSTSFTFVMSTYGVGLLLLIFLLMFLMLYFT